MTGARRSHVPVVQAVGMVVTVGAASAQLPDDLANQIAAGEVVERPASVVKELVENAIDAEATPRPVTVEYGGKRLIRVEDDGVGMDPDDARLCLERHATSKIRHCRRPRRDRHPRVPRRGAARDRLGLALPDAHPRSRRGRRHRDPGQRRRRRVGRRGRRPEGTLIEVADLFYNLPARRKFLKSDAAESAHVSEGRHAAGAVLPARRLHADERGRELLRVPARAIACRSAVPDLRGPAGSGRGATREAAGAASPAFVAALAEHGPTRGPQNVFVNRRIVKDKTIAHAILDAYSVASNKERSPEVHLFLDVPPDRVDVNVHPTKAEVRFASSRSCTRSCGGRWSTRWQAATCPSCRRPL